MIMPYLCIKQTNTIFMQNYLIDSAISKGNLDLAIEETNKALADGISAKQIIDEYLIKGMEEIGQAFQEGKAFVPNLLMAARAMKGSLDILKPLLKVDADDNFKAKVVIGTVKGDLHDIGKNLVASMLEGCGFEVINLGVNVTSEQFIASIKENGAEVVCMSALLTTTMTYMKEIVEAIESEGLRDKVKIMVGGAPLSSSFAQEIGADGYSENANLAVALARQLVEAI